jgi:hypothetical protein
MLCGNSLLNTGAAANLDPPPHLPEACKYAYNEPDLGAFTFHPNDGTFIPCYPRRPFAPPVGTAFTRERPS